MELFFEFNGRGTRQIGRSKILQLDPDDSAVFLITTRIGKVDFIMAWCRSAIVEKWGCYSFCAFVRASSSDLSRSWTVLVESELMIYHAVSIYLVPEEPWMTKEIHEKDGSPSNDFSLYGQEVNSATYSKYKSVEKFAYRATLEEIRDNDYNLNNPRYVDTFEEEAEIDLPDSAEGDGGVTPPAREARELGVLKATCPNSAQFKRFPSTQPKGRNAAKCLYLLPTPTHFHQNQKALNRCGLRL